MLKKLLIVSMAILITFPEVFVRLIYSVTIIPITNALAINYFLGGLILTSFYTGYTISNLPMGYFVDKYGFRVVSFSLFIMAILIYAFSFIENYLEAILLMFFIGIFSGPTYIGSVKLIAEKSESYKSTSIGTLNLVAPLTLFIVNVYSLKISIDAWRIVYLYLSILTFFIAIIVLFIKNEKYEHRKGAINIISILTSLARFFGFWGLWGTSSFLYLLIFLRFNSYYYAGISLIIFSIGSIIASPVSGFISDYFRIRERIIILSLIIFFIFLIIFPFIPFNLLYIFSFFLGFVVYFFRTPLDTYIAEITKGRAATSMGLANLISQPSQIIVPAIIGSIIEYSKNIYYAFIFLSLGPLFSALIVFYMEGYYKKH